MWITTVNGFVSIVQDNEDADVLQVRARNAEDITAIFPGAGVCIMPGADYCYRARLAKGEVAQTLAQAVLDIDYDSHFKDVALQRSPKNPARSGAYYGTWTAMARMQDQAPYRRTARADGDELFPAEVWPAEFLPEYIVETPFTADGWVWELPDESEPDR